MTNIKQQGRGFTIVELLIVIVVIAILAAISIVAYNGIQDRGKSSSGQSLASQIAKKAEAHNTVASSYPTAIGDFANVPEAELDDTSAILSSTVSAGATPTVNGTTADGGSVVSYTNASATGGCVGWWDYTNNAIEYVRVGSATC